MDKNKTPLTHRVTAMAVAYLDGLGCKPVETEVPVAPGWVADVASYWYPTLTEAKRMQLNKRVANVGELFDWPRVFGYGPFSVLVEVKTTKQDFARDRKWSCPPPAHFCFVAYPRGMIDEGELPQGWHGLETSADGTQLKKVSPAHCNVHPQHPGILLDFIANVGIRRDHRTRYAAERAWIKAANTEDRKTQKQYRAAKLLDNLANWLRGTGRGAHESFEQMLKDAGIKALPKYAREGAAYFRELKQTLAATDGATDRITEEDVSARKE